MAGAPKIRPRILTGDNPFNIDPKTEFVAVPERQTPHWNETHFFTVWSPEEKVGLFVHLGVCPQDLDLWWAQVFAYLPNGELVVDMSWGRPRDNRTPGTGNLEYRCDEPFKRWTSRFDGAGEKTTTDKMGRGIVGSGICVPMRFEVELEAINPIWDFFKATEIGERSWAAMHHEQHMLCKGSLTVDGKTWRLDGCTFRDHSSGARNLAGFGSVSWLGVAFPKSRRALMALVMRNTSGGIEMNTAYLTDGTSMELMDGVDMPGLDDTIGNPRSFTASMRRVSGEPLSVKGEVLHCATFCTLEPYTNINGIGFEETNPILLAECPIKVTLPDGEVGYGNWERHVRWNDLPNKRGR